MIKSVVSIVCIFPLLLFSQQLSNISIKGLKKTRESYVRQFLTIEVGDQINSEAIERDRRMLTNLEMFSHVHAEVVPVDSLHAEVLFQCNELYTLLPIFSFGGIEENFWVQAGLSEVNLAGRGHKLTAYYQYYDRSSAAIHLTLDRLAQSQWGANFNFVKWSTLEPLFFDGVEVAYEYDNWTGGATITRNFQYRDKLEFGGAFFTEDFTKVGEGVAAAPAQVKKRKVLGKLLHTIDRVDYFYFYQDGLKNFFNLQTVRSLDGDPAFYIAFNDLHYYKRFRSKGNLAIRYRMGLSSNEASPFAPFVLDSYLNIRGVGNRVDRGTGAIILNAEYRHTLFERQKVAVQGVL
ncbi:MAG: POTRA domain-containing protein, partial [Bacteroidota bacterium]